MGRGGRDSNIRDKTKCFKLLPSKALISKPLLFCYDIVNITSTGRFFAIRMKMSTLFYLRNMVENSFQKSADQVKTEFLYSYVPFSDLRRDYPKLSDEPT
jgi:hypothetical protein